MSNDEKKRCSSIFLTTFVLGSALSSNIAFCNAEEVTLPEARTSLQVSIEVVKDYISLIDNSRDIEKKTLTTDLLKPSLSIAANILSNNESTIEDITTINTTLNKTLNFIKNTNWTYEEEMALLDLSAKIDEIEAFLEGITIGNDIGNYRESDYETINEALINAKSFHSNNTSSTATLDEIILIHDNLQQAFNIFQMNVITEVDKTSLLSVISECENEIANAEIGDTPGKHYQSSYDKFRIAIDNARIIADDRSSNIESVNNAIINLTEALERFRDERIHYDDINRESLTNSINNANKLYEDNKLNLGFDKGNFLEISYVEFGISIRNAENAHAYYNASQLEIDNATKDLIEAIARFENSVITVDKSELTSLLAEALELLNSPDVGIFPEYAREELLDEYETGINIYETVHYNQTEITQACDRLKITIKNYKDSEINGGIDIPNEDEDKDEDDGENKDETINSHLEVLNNIKDSFFEDIENNKNIEDKIILKNKVSKIKLDCANAEQYIIEHENNFDIDVFYEKINEIKNKIDDFYKTESELIEKSRNELILITEECIALSDKILEEYQNESSSKFDGISTKLLNSLKKELLLEYNKGYVDAFIKEVASASEVLAKNENIIKNYEDAASNLLAAKEKLLKKEEPTETPENPPTEENTTPPSTDSESDNSQNSNDNESISEEEQSQIDECSAQIERILLEIQSELSVTTVGFENGQCTENEKRATMYMYSTLTQALESSNRIWEYQSILQRAKATLSDFKDRSISIDSYGTVNGNKLTGKKYELTVVPTSEEIISYTEFIPKAGMPIDIKLVLTNLGISFMAIGALLRRKK